MLGTGVQQTGLSTETMYMAVAIDELGCIGQAMFSIEKPKADVLGPPAWGMNGNLADGSAVAPQQGGEPTAPWLGTVDSTDVVMKANGVPQLRLGANGVTSVEGQLRLAQLQEATLDTSEPQFKLMVAGDDGLLKVIDPSMFWVNISRNRGDCFGGGFQPLEVQGQWYSGINKLYSCPPVNVGIGTDVPQSKLDVRGNTYSQFEQHQPWICWTSYRTCTFYIVFIDDIAYRTPVYNGINLIEEYRLHLTLLNS